MGAQWYDGLITIPGCDKNMPGSVMAMARLNRPSLMVYGGTIRAGPRAGQAARHHLGVPVLRRVPGRHHHRRAAARHRPARLPGRRRLRRHVHGQHDGRRPSRRWGCRCRTARRMPAEDPGKADECRRAGAAVRLLLERDLKPLDILTPQGVRERDDAGDGGRRLDQRRAAPAGDRAHGGRAARRSTDFQRVSDRVPLLADLKPSGQLRAGGPARRRRHAGADEVPAGARASCTATR